MPKFTTTGDKLKDLLKLMDVCNNYTKLTFRPDSLTFTSIDPSRTCMLVGKVNPQIAFNSYEGEGESIYIDIKDFDTVLKRVKKNDASFTVENGEITVKEKNTTWSVRMLDDCTSPPTPNLETENSFTIGVSAFEEEVTRAMDGGDILSFTLGEDGITITGKEDYKKGITTVVPKEDLTEYVYNNPATSSYSKTFMEDAFKVLPKDVVLKVGVDDAYPLVMKILSPNNAYEATLYVAPRLNEEDDL